MAKPRSTAKSTTAPAAQTRAMAGSARRASIGSAPASAAGSCGFSVPSTESTVTRTIWGMSALKTWLKRLISSPRAKSQATGLR